MTVNVTKNKNCDSFMHDHFSRGREDVLGVITTATFCGVKHALMIIIKGLN